MARQNQAKIFITRFTAVGSSSFPIDMMRYDECFPVEERGAHQIAASLDMATAPSGELRIEIEMRKRGGGGPKVARWASYGWRIENIQPQLSSPW